MKFKFYIFFFLFIFLIYFGSTATLTLSPTQIDFVGKTNEIICQKVNIETKGIATLIGQTKWAEEGYFERKLSKHKLTSKEIGIEIKIPELITIENKSEIEVCIEGSKKGNYHGALLYRIEGKPVQVGIWMNVSLKGNEMMKITGNFVKTGEGGNLGVYFAVILFLILGGLLIWSKVRSNG